VNDAPLVAGPVYGLRTWVVVGPPGEERLAGPHSATPWPDGGQWLSATCARDPSHHAPEHECVCGLHAWHPSRDTARRVLAPRREVAGVVECDGAIEVHPEGFRAARGRPRALVVTPMRNRALVTRLATAYAADVATVDGPDGLVAWCRERDLGLEPAVVDDLLGPGTASAFRTTARRRRRHLVGGIAAWIVVAILLALLASFALPDSKEPHVVRGRAGEVTIP
jgi:hypothetical protein